MVNEERLVNSFLELVKIDSPSRKERAIADFLRGRLQELGLEVLEDEAGSKIGSGTGNLIARLPGTGGAGKPPIFLSAHMDTVEPGCGIIPVLKDGVITSQGETILGGDDKSGIAAILEAVRVIREQNLPHGDLELVFTVCEEVGLLGASHLEPGSVKAKMGFILDAGGPVGTIIIKGPSQNRIDAGIVGKAAHTGIEPEKGISAIVVAANAISRMTLGRIDNETTANIGMIEGGRAINIIPDLVNLKGEARSLNPEKLEAQTAHMVENLEKAAEQAGARVQINVEHLYPHIDISPDSPQVRAAVTAAENLGIKVSLEATGGGSDANIFCGKGLAAVNLGNGMSKVHTVDEFITVADLVSMARYLVEIIKVV
ncbi:MAG TPA: M20/M25/M40 family metallo-hydrolase [Bacillota bacterium]|nr:M20/M25/M40 family metallo-hydrolase [Bacillota bacterium]